MKRIFLSALVGVGMTAAILQVSSGSSSARTPEDYPLVCRGGGTLVIGIAPGERNIGFTFVRGTKPAGEGLAPGECSWVDRGMYPNEPDRVSQHVEEGSDSLKVGGTLAPENRWYEELHSSDKYWIFMVSNNGRGELIATSARPNPGMDVSPTARVPPDSMTPQPKASPGPGMNVRTPDETPKVIVLNGQPEPSSKPKLEGLPFDRNINIPPAPLALTREEKMGLLKSAGLETFDEKLTPYVTLTPRQPHVAGSTAWWGGADLVFISPGIVNAGMWGNVAEFPDLTGSLSVHLGFETKGLYLVTFTVNSETVGEFLITEEMEYFPGQKFLKPGGWQHLNMIVEVTGPGSYHFTLKHEAKAKNHWWFSSCEVVILKK